VDARPGDHVCLSVTDSGCGMTADLVARIFDPFFTTRPAGKGTGLGLAMVHGAVKENQGAIQVESTPGQGTCFRIYFPCCPTS
jgi:signal transduction histidine kinase